MADNDWMKLLSNQSAYANAGSANTGKGWGALPGFLMDMVGGAYSAYSQGGDSTLIPGLMNAVQGLRKGQYYNQMKAAADAEALSQWQKENREIGDKAIQRKQLGKFARLFNKETGEYDPLYIEDPSVINNILNQGGSVANYNAALEEMKRVYSQQVNTPPPNIDTSGPGKLGGWDVGGNLQGGASYNTSPSYGFDVFGQPSDFPAQVSGVFKQGQSDIIDRGRLAETIRSNQEDEDLDRKIYKAKLAGSGYTNFPPNPPNAPQPTKWSILKEMRSQDLISQEEYESAVMKDSTMDLLKEIFDKETPGEPAKTETPAKPKPTAIENIEQARQQIQDYINKNKKKK